MKRIFLFSSSLFASLLFSMAGAAQLEVIPQLRTSNMNHDVVIHGVLFQALVASVGKNPFVHCTPGTTMAMAMATPAASALATATLISGNDMLACRLDGCELTWDSQSVHYPADSAKFQSALFDVLENYALLEGKLDPYLHRAEFSQTGSVQLTVMEGTSDTDNVQCLLTNPRSAFPFKECSLTVSDSVAGVEKEYKDMYFNLLNSKSLIDPIKIALVTSVSTAQFLSDGNLQFGNNFYSVTHTLDTRIIIDLFKVSANYAYKIPLRNLAGQIVSNGIVVTVVGSKNRAGLFASDEVSAHSYSLGRR